MQQDKQAISTKNHALFTYSRDGAVCKWPSFKGIVFRHIRPIHWSDASGRISCIGRIGYFGKYTNGRSFIIYFD